MQHPRIVRNGGALRPIRVYIDIGRHRAHDAACPAVFNWLAMDEVGGRRLALYSVQTSITVNPTWTLQE